jgi:hypothetical protein
MARYRRSLVSFVRTLPMWLERGAGDGAAAALEDGHAPDEDVRGGLTAIDGGRAS